MTHKRIDDRPHRNASAATAAAVLIQAVLGLEFLLGGLNKLFVPNYAAQFKDFVTSAPGAQHGLLSQIMQVAVLPQSAIMAELARLTELGAGIILLMAAAELGGRQLNMAPGRRFEAAITLVTAAAAAAVGGLSLTIYLLHGGGLPRINPALAFAPPIAIELFNVPVALGIAWLGFNRYLALRNVSGSAANDVVGMGTEMASSPASSGS
jgi:hypothetical protein